VVELPKVEDRKDYKVDVRFMYGGMEIAFSKSVDQFREFLAARRAARAAESGE
jgi:hypothetical protein